jgi:hypothetical protein
MQKVSAATDNPKKEESRDGNHLQEHGFQNPFGEGGESPGNRLKSPCPFFNSVALFAPCLFRQGP